MELIWHVPLGDFIVVTDRSRPPGLLEFLVRSTWRTLPDTSPNSNASHPAISLFELDERDVSEPERLVGHICHILEKPRVEVEPIVQMAS
jgi:hypothetical protein